MAKQGVRILSIPTGSTRTLQVGLKAFGRFKMDYGAHIVFVNAHTKSLGGYDYRSHTLLEASLNFRPDEIS